MESEKARRGAEEVQEGEVDAVLEACFAFEDRTDVWGPFPPTDVCFFGTDSCRTLANSRLVDEDWVGSGTRKRLFDVMDMTSPCRSRVIENPADFAEVKDGE